MQAWRFRPRRKRWGMSGSRSWPGLRGRRNECERLSGLVAQVLAGHSQVLVLRGEAGIGKTALLEFLVDRAAGCRVARAAGVESEMELANACLHQLCSPYLDRVARLPAPQQDALGTAFGLRTGVAPDRFLVGLAVLTLLCEVAEEMPLICVVDDAQWLDRASLQTLEFVARRLGAERLAMVFAVRESDDGARGWPGCRNSWSAAWATSMRQSCSTRPCPGHSIPWYATASWRSPTAIRSRSLELPRGLTATEMAFGGNAVGSVAATLQPPRAGIRAPAGAPSAAVTPACSWRRPSEPVGDVTVLWRAAERLGIGADAATAAEEAGLIELDEQVRFRHPLVRSAAYRSATPAERRQVHRALADVTDPDIDPDRRAWHRAHAVLGTDEAVAAELDRAAAPRALVRGSRGSGRLPRSGGRAHAGPRSAGTALTRRRPGRGDRRGLRGGVGPPGGRPRGTARRDGSGTDRPAAGTDRLQLELPRRVGPAAAGRRAPPGTPRRKARPRDLSGGVVGRRVLGTPRIGSGLVHATRGAGGAGGPAARGAEQGGSAPRRACRALHRRVRGVGAVGAPRGPGVTAPRTSPWTRRPTAPGSRRSRPPTSGTTCTGTCSARSIWTSSAGREPSACCLSRSPTAPSSTFIAVTWRPPRPCWPRGTGSSRWPAVRPG